MQITCQNCSHRFDAPDADAGKLVPCPNCKADVQVPVLMNAPPLEPTVIGPAPGLTSTSPPIPPVVPPVVPPTAKVPPPPLLPEVPVVRIEPTSDPLPPGYANFRLAKLPVQVVLWLPAVALCLALVLTFFRWTGQFPAGYPAYTQTGLGAMVGTFSRNIVSDKELKLHDTLREQLSGNWLLLPYLLTLIAAAATAVGMRVFEGRGSPPAALAGLWPHRVTLLTVFTGLTLVLLLLQLQIGLGLENATLKMVQAKHTDSVETIEKEESDETKQVAAIRIARDLGALHLHRTTWLSLVVWSEWAALIAVGIQLGLRRRGEKPPPGVAALW